ncbi:CcdC family protein [Bhargavaea beijingensis]|uniref:Cytochrome c biogenesis protein CcdC n=1 Tax=Bhargavaea beijingensis TaxID=426756 RepID=A0A1G7DGR0_9BACL|nr:cytochrome c biogenesis protein CcdC [Bhargavaea beijingensis]MCW1927192.1 cytochrome c biogenesis protein CcdC [Bhargavaea beijingensis]RSK30911.1 cytochrome c biogenesis protein CcdC [Bhargavaea beijingensis]SDE50697.1 Membrane protein CcdC involved in cytochrome C biogenesis [Bhargavaea beijingensis]
MNEFVNWVFTEIPAPVLIIGSTVIFAMAGLGAVIMRSRASKQPASAKKIILPPIMMSTGALMFLFEPFRVAWPHVFEALTVGILFSTLLIRTSKFEESRGEIYLKPSKAFLFILAGLLVLRVAGKLILSSTIDVGELAGMFFLLAFGMIVPWRIAMYVKFKKLQSRTRAAA